MTDPNDLISRTRTPPHDQETADLSETNRIPRLLVSVRNSVEAHAAIAGGCDVLDVKEPNHGSLGRAALSQIQSIAQIATSAGCPCSAALGEAIEWASSCDADRWSTATLPRMVKLGLSQLGSRSDWISHWQSVIDAIQSTCHQPAQTWVAVIYADAAAADSPQPDQILDAIVDEAVSLGQHISGVLVDTFSKSSGTLLDAMSVDDLNQIARRTQQSGRFFALAGRLNVDMLETVAGVRPDVIAIRSAACVGKDRRASVDQAAVAAFRERIVQAFSGCQPVGTA